MPTAESRLILFQPWEALLNSCSCQDGAKGVADHCPKTRGQAAVCPQRDHGFMAGAAEQAGSTCWAPHFLNRICIRYPPTLSPRLVWPWSRLVCLERMGELPQVTPAGRGWAGAHTRHVCLHHLCPFCNGAGFVVTGSRLCLPAGQFGPPPQIPSLASTFFLFLDLFPLFLSPFTFSCNKPFVAFSLGLARILLLRHSQF